MAGDIIVGGGNRSMPNIKSQIKRDRKNKEQQAKNKAEKSAMKTAMKKFDAAVTAGDKEAAAESLRVATSELSKAGSKGIYHKNTVSRKISRLSAAVNKMA